MSPLLPAMCPSVSITQKKTDLVLEDIEQEVREELENKEDLKPSKKEVSLT